MLTPGEDSGVSCEAEVSYCKVKLFRDHGAERKLSNDVAHVKKTIEKLKQQLAQAEMGGGYGKRKRGSMATSVKNSDKSARGSKHKRDWSMGSEDGASEKLTMEDDLQAKLGIMQDMFSSTLNVSVLALRGDPEDDPDLFPVRLPAESDGVKVESLDLQNNSASHSMLSPTSRNASLSPHMGNKNLNSSGVHKIAKENPKAGYIEAVDIDTSYRPPAKTAAGMS